MNFFSRQKNQIFILVLLFLLALVLRLFIAAHASGHSDDILLFQVWSFSATKNGLAHVYDTPIGKTTSGHDIPLPNYLPFYLYFLKLDGLIYRFFFSPEFKIGLEQPLTFLLKLNGITFDLLIGFFIFFLLKRKIGFSKAIFSSSLFLFHPAMIYNSAYWGQVDAIHSFFILLTIYFVTQKKYTWSWIFMVLALLMKLQSIIILPLLVFLSYKKLEMKKFLFNIIPAGLVFFVISLPFLFQGKFMYVLKTIFSSAGYSPFLTLNAYNIWWPFTSGNFLSFRDTELFLGLIPYSFLGLILFFSAWVFSLWVLNKRDETEVVFFTAAFIAFAFFMLPTEMHERYMFPVFSLLAMIFFTVKPIKWIYGVLSLTYFLNLITVFPPSSLEGILDTSMGKTLWIVWVNMFVFLYFIYCFSLILKKKLFKLK